MIAWPTLPEHEITSGVSDISTWKDSTGVYKVTCSEYVSNALPDKYRAIYVHDGIENILSRHRKLATAQAVLEQLERWLAKLTPLKKKTELRKRGVCFFEPDLKIKKSTLRVHNST